MAANHGNQHSSRQAGQGSGGYRPWKQRARGPVASSGGGSRRSRSPPRRSSPDGRNRNHDRERARGRTRRRSRSLGSTSSSERRRERQVERARRILEDRSAGYRDYKEERKRREQDALEDKYTQRIADRVLGELEPLKKALDGQFEHAGHAGKAKAKAKGPRQINNDDDSADEELDEHQTTYLKLSFRNRMDFTGKTKKEAINIVYEKLDKSAETKWFKEACKDWWSDHKDIKKPAGKREQARVMVEATVHPS